MEALPFKEGAGFPFRIRPEFCTRVKRGAGPAGQAGHPVGGNNSKPIVYLWRMQALLQKLRNIELKIKVLGDRYELLKQQNKQLKQENISLKQDLDLLSQDRMVLVRELESAKSHMVQGKLSEKEKKAKNKLLGLYIREVDKCINLMQEIS